MKAGKLTTTSKAADTEAQVIPLFGRDEMNLVEFPFGPVTQSTTKTLEVEHEVFDKTLNREVTRRLMITGSDAFGLPRPVDDQVLIGMKALTHDAGYKSRVVKFSRYQLCRAIGWEPDGRAYQRLEESFDRIAGTTLKFKDAWWDKGEREWKSKTFHLIEEVNLCSRDELDRKRKSLTPANRLCSFVWSDVIWKSFQDGFIKSLDMEMFRRIASGRRRDVPLRLFRILDKRFHYGNVARLKLERLCVGTLGLSSSYSPSQMIRVLRRAYEWLTECGFLAGMKIGNGRITRHSEVHFLKATAKRHERRLGTRAEADTQSGIASTGDIDDHHRTWLLAQNEAELLLAEAQALAAGFGTELERRLVAESRTSGAALLSSGRIRTQYIEKFVRSRRSE